MKSKWYIFIIIAVFIAALFFIKMFSQPGSQPSRRALAELKTGVVAREDISTYVHSVGVIRPLDLVEVTSRVSAKVLEITKEEGDSVKQGEVLIQLDQADIATDIKQAELDTKKAQLRLEDLENQLANSRPLFQKGFISKNEWEDISMKLKLAEADYEKILSNEKLLKEKYGDIEIKAPRAGVVVERNIDKGVRVVGASASSNPTVILTIADPARRNIETLVNQVDIVKVTVGQKVEISMDAFPDERFRGTVTKISPKASVAGSLRVFRVTIEMIDDDSRLRLGVTVKVFIVVETKKNVLTVPIEAVFENDEGGEFCFVKTSFGRWAKKKVKTGISNLAKTEITDGLAEGDEIYLEDPREL